MAAAIQMTAGFGLGEVNPPLGMPMEGLGQQGGCQTIHDDLFVRLLALAAGRQQLLLVGFDLLFFERPVVDRFKAALWRRFGLAPDQILLNTSHTHAGPRLTRWAYGGDADPVYLEKIEAALVQAADQALAGRKPVRLEAGMATTEVPVSRRKPGPDGLTQWAPHLGGEVCNALPFCLFRDRTDAVVCLLFSVSCHPSMIYSLNISADYPGAATRQLNRHFQTGGAFFLQGAGGDTKPRQIAEQESHWRHGTWGEVEAAGKAVADAVVAAAGGLQPVTPDLRTCLFATDWPLGPLPDRQMLETAAADSTLPAGRRAWANEMLRRLDVLGRLPDTVEVMVHAVQLGRGLRLIGFEGELVGELGNRILWRYDRGITFPLGYTNGAQIYLPSSRMIPTHGYEVDSFWEYHHAAPLRLVTDDVVEKALDYLQGPGGIRNTTAGGKAGG